MLLYVASRLAVSGYWAADSVASAVYDSARGLLAHALHSQVAMHEAYGGVVPELASRDHVRRVVPLTQRILAQLSLGLSDLDAIAYTKGPGLAGALLVGVVIGMIGRGGRS